MLIWVYFALDFQHNPHIVYVRPVQQDYLWAFCLTRNIHYMQQHTHIFTSKIVLRVTSSRCGSTPSEEANLGLFPSYKLSLMFVSEDRRDRSQQSRPGTGNLLYKDCQDRN